MARTLRIGPGVRGRFIGRNGIFGHFALSLDGRWSLRDMLFSADLVCGLIF